MKNKKRNFWIKDFKISLIVSLLIAVAFLFQAADFKKYSQSQSKKIDNIKNSIVSEENRKSKLAKEKEYSNSNEYIEKIAREMLGLVDKNDIIIRPER